MDQLPPPLPLNHFLNLQRPNILVPTATGTPDTSTLAAHDFDVDTRTGFMPPQEPLARLPPAWEAWEAALDDALSSRLQLANKPGLSAADEADSERWRNVVREVSGRSRGPLVMRSERLMSIDDVSFRYCPPQISSRLKCSSVARTMFSLGSCISTYKLRR